MELDILGDGKEEAMVHLLFRRFGLNKHEARALAAIPVVMWERAIAVVGRLGVTQATMAHELVHRSCLYTAGACVATYIGPQCGTPDNPPPTPPPQPPPLPPPPPPVPPPPVEDVCPRPTPRPLKSGAP